MPADAPSFRIRADVRYRPVADEGVVVRQQAGEVLVLNEVGIRVLTLLGEGLAAPAIIARLASEFDTDTDRLAADVAAFIAELGTAGVIEEDPQS